MPQIVYVTPVDDIASGIKAAFDIYSGSGMQAKMISDGRTSLRFRPSDARKVICEQMTVKDYVLKHQME